LREPSPAARFFFQKEDLMGIMGVPESAVSGNASEIPDSESGAWGPKPDVQWPNDSAAELGRGLRPRPKVRDVCKVCEGSQETGIGAIVSPQGLEHVGLAEGTTACGKDATGEGWWWPA
jgi:hypothetical protein